MTMQFASIVNLSPTAAQRTRARREAQQENHASIATGSFWRDFMNAAFNPYRPEDHYMRGPGPAWHAKNGASSAAR
jgi:hypothetical protein